MRTLEHENIMSKNKCRSFTFIETILYLVIISTVLISIVKFSLTIVESRNENYVVREVHANARLSLDIISQRIRSATSVNVGSSTWSTDPGVLSLAMADANKNPTVIDLTADNGSLRVTEGVNPAVIITSDQVDVTNLVFTNLTSSESDRENVRIEITVAYDTSVGDVEFTYSKSLQTAVSVRQ